MLNNKKLNRKGFTIIEVLIVLAIAGLILLVVLLAVPALQRNSRNTALKTDASAIAGAVTEFENNNSGAMPTTIAIANGTVTVSSSVAGTTAATGKVQGGTTGTGSATATAPATGTNGVVNVAIGFKCNGNVVGAASARAVAILYNLETSSTTAPQCLES